MTKTKKLTVLLSIILMLVLSIFGVVITSSIPQVAASADEITSENFPDTSTWTKTEYNGEPVGGKIIRLEGDLETYADFICVGPAAMHFVKPDRTADKVRFVCSGMSGSAEWELPHAFGEGFVDVYFPYANFSVLDGSVPMTFYSRTDGGFFGDFFDASFGNGKAYIMSNGAADNASALPEGMAAELNQSVHEIGGRTFRVYKNETFAVTADCPNLINIKEGGSWYVQLNTTQGTATLMHSLAGAVYYFSVDVNTEEYYEFDIPAITVTATNEALDGGKEDLNLAEAHWFNDGYGTVTDAYFYKGGSLYSMVTPTAGDSGDEGQTPTPEEPEVPSDEPDEIVLPEGMTEYDFSSPIGGKTFRIYDFKGANVASFNLLQGDLFYFININKTTQQVSLDYNGFTTKKWVLESTFTEDYVEFKVPAASYSVEWVDAETQETMTDEIDLRVVSAMKSSEADWTLYAMETVTSEPEVPGDEPETPSDDEEKPTIGDWIDGKIASVSDFLSEYTGYSISAGFIIIAIIVIVLIRKK